jgi:hypothetical protein
LAFSGLVKIQQLAGFANWMGELIILHILRYISPYNPEFPVHMPKKKKKKKPNKVSKKRIRREVTEKLAQALKNYKLGNSKKKFRKMLKKAAKIVEPLALKTVKKLGWRYF